VRVLFVKQDHVSAAGPVAEAFADLGYDVADLLVVPPERFATPDVTVAFPDPAAFDAIVPMGAPWSVYDEARIGSWVGTELAFLRRAVAAGVPVLGICFGGQALAAALGGRVERAAGPEIGWRLLDTDQPGLIEPGPWFQWHLDRWRLPAGVRALARTQLAEQAFIVGRSLGVQFHPEMTPGTLAGWLDNGGTDQLAEAGLDAERLLDQTQQLAVASAGRARALVRRFTEQVATRPPAG
jgi:GMP synthase-like glutamine amidotransferase